jgi:hypothetical protein
MPEVSSTSALPEPTRLGSTSLASSAAHERGNEQPNVANSEEHLEDPSGPAQESGGRGADDATLGVDVVEMSQSGTVPSHEIFLYSTDELAVLAESFFQQRNGNIVDAAGDWWNSGNL